MSKNGNTTSAGRIVFLVDIDNTLLDNDRFGQEVSARLEQDFGPAGRQRYWGFYEERRARLGFADYLGALEDFRAGQPAAVPLLQIPAFLLEYPFAQRLYPRALEAIARLRTLGAVVVLTDGDVTFQTRKAQRSGIWEAVDGNVLICVHKQDSFEFVQRHYPADHYVAVDDKPDLLAAIKSALGARFTSVWVRQGHYAREAAGKPIRPEPDISVDTIAALISLDEEHFNPRAA